MSPKFSQEALFLNPNQSILLVGGFGESKFIYNRLKTCHEPTGVQILQVNGAFGSLFQV